MTHDSGRNGVPTTGGVAHGGAVLQLLELVENASLIGDEGVETTLLNAESGDFEGFLITPIVDLGHRVIIHEHKHVLVTVGAVDTGLMLDEFAFETGLEVGGPGSVREVNSLEGSGISVEFLSIHDEDGGLGGTGGTDEERVLEAVLLSDHGPLKRQCRHLVDNVFGTGGVRGGDKELGEDNLLGG